MRVVWCHKMTCANIYQKNKEKMIFMITILFLIFGPILVHKMLELDAAVILRFVHYQSFSQQYYLQKFSWSTLTSLYYCQISNKNAQKSQFEWATRRIVAEYKYFTNSHFVQKLELFAFTLGLCSISSSNCAQNSHMKERNSQRIDDS